MILDLNKEDDWLKPNGALIVPHVRSIRNAYIINGGEIHRWKYIKALVTIDGKIV